MKNKPEPYRPSNGSEGDDFCARFCDRCEKDREWREKGMRPCPILGATLNLAIGEPGYPPEWIYGADGKPTCTAFEKEASDERK